MAFDIGYAFFSHNIQTIRDLETNRYFPPSKRSYRQVSVPKRKPRLSIIGSANTWLEFLIDDAAGVDRRAFVNELIQVASFLGSSANGLTPIDSTGLNLNAKRVAPIEVTLPLELSSGGTFCVRCTLLDDQTNALKVYRAIVDTGSPYLVLPSSELGDDFAPKWTTSLFTNLFTTLGFKRNIDERSPLLLTNSDYPPTKEVYGSVTGQIDWKMADFRFRDPLLQIANSFDIEKSSVVATRRGVVGVLDNALTAEATGGVGTEPYALLGIIKNNNPTADSSRFPDPRPTFLEQERIAAGFMNMTSSLNEFSIKSFSLNCPQRELKFSSGSLIASEEETMTLIDLRPYGDFVDHYSVLVDSVTFDGLKINSKILQKASGGFVERPIVAVFDSGLTGSLLTTPFWNIMQTIIRNADLNESSTSNTAHEFKSVEVSIRNSLNTKRIVSRSSTKTNIQSSHALDPRLFYVEPIDLDWFDDNLTCPYVIVLGQTFLSRGVLTIDLERRLAAFNLINSV